jgi:hypothetical protein
MQMALVLSFTSRPLYPLGYVKTDSSSCDDVQVGSEAYEIPNPIKGKAASAHAMKVSRGSIDTAPLILNLGIRWSGQLHASTALPRDKNPVPIEEEAGCAPQPVWTFSKIEKFCPWPDANLGQSSP